MNAVRHLPGDGDDRGQLELARFVVDRRVGADHAFRDDHLLDRHFFTAVMRDEKPGSLKISRVASPMLVPWIVTVTWVPRCAPVGVSFCRVGGAVCAGARPSCSP